MDEREKSLQVVEEVSFLKRVFNFFKSIFKTNNTNYFIEDKKYSSNNDSKNSFIKSIKYDEDPDIAKLLKIQDELEKKGINEANAYELTKDLSDIQKGKLENLYKEQISNYENSIEISKNKIMNIRKKLA